MVLLEPIRRARLWFHDSAWCQRAHSKLVSFSDIHIYPSNRNATKVFCGTLESIKMCSAWWRGRQDAGGRGQRPQPDPDSHHSAQTWWNLFDFNQNGIKTRNKKWRGGGKKLWRERKSMLKCVKRWRSRKSLNIKGNSEWIMLFFQDVGHSQYISFHSGSP